MLHTRGLKMTGVGKRQNILNPFGDSCATTHPRNNCLKWPEIASALLCILIGTGVNKREWKGKVNGKFKVWLILISRSLISSVKKMCPQKHKLIGYRYSKHQLEIENMYLPKDSVSITLRWMFGSLENCDITNISKLRRGLKMKPRMNSFQVPLRILVHYSGNLLEN